MKIRKFSDRYVLETRKHVYLFIRHKKYTTDKSEFHDTIYVLPSIVYERDYEYRYIRFYWIRFRANIEILHT